MYCPLRWSVTFFQTYDLQESLRLLSPQRVPKSSSESLGVPKETNRRQRTACGLEGATPLLMRCALVFFLFENRKEALPWDVGAPATKNFPPSRVGFLQGRRIFYLAPACYQTAGSKISRCDRGVEPVYYALFEMDISTKQNLCC